MTTANIFRTLRGISLLRTDFMLARVRTVALLKNNTQVLISQYLQF
ncbi:hypothetical protein [Candidatus Pseudomonas adelgestsugas]|nr:hypothetical protein [Candidatus Pseudomonas adelgestsugas]